MIEMSLAVPQVVAQRTLQIAAAGASPSARDRKEFALMGSEKVLAFQQSWMAMGLQMFRMQMSWMQSLAGLSMTPLVSRRGVDASRAAHAAARVLAAGVAPVHAKAVANAKRLARKRR